MLDCTGNMIALWASLSPIHKWYNTYSHGKIHLWTHLFCYSLSQFLKLQLSFLIALKATGDKVNWQCLFMAKIYCLVSLHFAWFLFISLGFLNVFRDLSRIQLIIWAQWKHSNEIMKWLILSFFYHANYDLSKIQLSPCPNLPMPCLLNVLFLLLRNMAWLH